MFVAVSGEDLNVKCKITIPANHTGGIFNCFNTLNKKIFNRTIHQSGIAQEKRSLTVLLKNVSSSGVYYCMYQDVKVDWFLRVRGENREINYRTSSFVNLDSHGTVPDQLVQGGG